MVLAAGSLLQTAYGYPFEQNAFAFCFGWLLVDNPKSRKLRTPPSVRTSCRVVERGDQGNRPCRRPCISRVDGIPCGVAVHDSGAVRPVAAPQPVS